MRPVQVSVHNFRSIRECNVFLSGCTVIAGENNCGKTTLIDAIRVFYGDLKWNRARDFPKMDTHDGESWVEITFLLSSSEVSLLKDSYADDESRLRVRCLLTSEAATNGGKPRSPGHYAYENGELSDTPFYGTKNVGTGKFGKLVYIPAVSKVDEHTKLTGPSALRDLVSTVIDKALLDSPAYKKLATDFGDFESGLKTHTSGDGPTLKDLESDLNDGISGWDATFALELSQLQPEDLLKMLIRPTFIDQAHGEAIDQQDFGAGFQRALIFELISLAAKYSVSGKAKSTASNSFSPSLTWILFEEPEAFLHPTQEDVLYDGLLKLSEGESNAVLVTTHSSRFVSRSMKDLTRLVRLRRSNAITSAFQLSQDGLERHFAESDLRDAEIAPAISSGNNADKAAVMSALKNELWIQPQRAAAFFARRVILVEGPTEVAAISYLNSRGLDLFPVSGVVAIDCMGKFNIHRFMSLLGAFGIDHSVLYDGDSGSSKDPEVTRSIEASKSSFTKTVTRLPDDIETFFGIDPLPGNQSHRKPQHLLYHFETKAIAQEKIDTFRNMISDLSSS